MEKNFKRIEDIEVWKRGCRLTVNIYKITGSGEFEKDWGFKDQIRRSALSIPSNIAEGFERDSDAEFKHFLNIAKGSCGELRTQLYIAQAVDHLKKECTEKFVKECQEISAMIHSLINHLKSK